VVGVWELTFAAREVVERTLAAFEIFLGVMAIYFLLCFPLSVISSRLERRLAIPSFA
jgi:ABC-type amino acid transport system permease subunit